MPQGPGLGKLTRNQFYEAVVASGLDPTEFNYEEINFGKTDQAVITHSSGSKFVMVRGAASQYLELKSYLQDLELELKLQMVPLKLTKLIGALIV